MTYSATRVRFNYFYIVDNKAKRRISKRVFQEDKPRQIFRKTNISYPLIRTRTCTYQGVRNVCFSENLACFVFLKHPFRDSPFCLITDDILLINLYFLNNLLTRRYLTMATGIVFYHRFYMHHSFKEFPRWVELIICFIKLLH